MLFRSDLVSVSIPFGIGIRYKLNHYWDLGFEAGVRYTFSDYLDDTGGYAANYSDLQGLSQVFGHREIEKFAALTGKDREGFIRDYVYTQGTKIINASSPKPEDRIAYLDPNLRSLSTLATAFDGELRNTSSRLNDMYVLTSFRIIYHIPPSIKCPVIK